MLLSDVTSRTRRKRDRHQGCRDWSVGILNGEKFDWEREGVVAGMQAGGGR